MAAQMAFPSLKNRKLQFFNNYNKQKTVRTCDWNLVHRVEDNIKKYGEVTIFSALKANIGSVSWVYKR